MNTTETPEDGVTGGRSNADSASPPGGGAGNVGDGQGDGVATRSGTAGNAGDDMRDDARGDAGGEVGDTAGGAAWDAGNDPGDDPGREASRGAGDDLGPGAGYGTAYGYQPAEPGMHDAGASGGVFGDALPDSAAPGSSPVPVVGATPALRGFPGGPGVGPVRDDAPVAGPADWRAFTAGSLWQRAQSVWTDSGVAWERPSSDWAPAEAGWERGQAQPHAPRLSRRRPGTGRRTLRPGVSAPGRGMPPPGVPDALRAPTPAPGTAAGTRRRATAYPATGYPATGRVPGGARPGTPRVTTPGRAASERTVAGRAGSRDGRARGGRSRKRRRSPGFTGGVLAIGVAVAAVIAVLFAVGMITAGRGAPAARPRPAPPPYPPARLAGADFAVYAPLAARGVTQSIDAVAARGATIVAAGSQTGTSIDRTLFFVSADGGRTWRLAPVTGQDHREQVTPQAPTAIAAGPAGWLALGRGASWTSSTGQSWQVSPVPGVTPALPGDRVRTLAATAGGFFAAGSAVRHPSAGVVSGPVIWTSPDGVRWQRSGPGQLTLPAAGVVGGIVFAAAHGDDLVISAPVTRTVVTGKGRKRRAAHLTAPGVWESADGGDTWVRSAVPVSNGAASALTGLAPCGAGFVAVRPAAAGTAGLAGVIYTSATGSNWSYAGKITTGRRAQQPTLAGVGGTDRGAVIAIATDGNLVALRSASGTSWQPTAVLGRAASVFLSGLTVTGGGDVVAAGASGSRGFLAVSGAHTAAVDLTAIPGDSFPQRSVSAMASAAGLDIAVGSANGYPAVWAAPHGQAWSRAVGADPGVFGRAAVSGLTGVIAGPAGWLAVGTSHSGAHPHPVVVYSRDGRTWQAADGQPPFAGTDANAVAAAYGTQGYVIVGSREWGGHTVAAVWRAPALTPAGPSPTPARNNTKTKRLPPLWTAGGDAGRGDLDGTDAPRIMWAVTAGPFGYVAVGQHGSRPAVWTSPDGRRWRLTGLPVPGGGVSASLRHVTASGGRVVAVGTFRTNAGTAAPLAAFSADGGRTWHEAGVQLPGGTGSLTGVTAAGGGFVAVGTIGLPGRLDVVVVTSPDGTAWKAVAPSGTGLSGPGTQEITALTTTAGGSLLGAGFTATQTADEPTLWIAPPVPAGTHSRVRTLAPAASPRTG